jgi:hypothetical protein
VTSRRSSLRAQPEPSAFLHIVAVDRQYSVHAAKKKPLSVAVAAAFKALKKTLPTSHRIELEDGTKLSATKTITENGIADDTVIYVRDPSQEPVGTPAKKSRKSTRKRR